MYEYVPLPLLTVDGLEDPLLLPLTPERSLHRLGNLANTILRRGYLNAPETRRRSREISTRSCTLLRVHENERGPSTP